VLGNHDYGGRLFYSAWDQQIAYTWGPTGRWVLPAQYYTMRVDYPSKNFSVDYFMLDTNIGDTSPPEQDQEHNMCNYHYNGNKSCAPFGPASAHVCYDWFKDLWAEQLIWIRGKLNHSNATWRIVLTHFPPEDHVQSPLFVDDFRKLDQDFGIDLIVAGHRHSQGLYGNGNNYWSGTAGIPYVVTGGGGGITSDFAPGFPSAELPEKPEGLDQYGYMDMRLYRDHLAIEAVSEFGKTRGWMQVWHRRAVPDIDFSIAPNAGWKGPGKPAAADE